MILHENDVIAARPSLTLSHAPPRLQLLHTPRSSCLMPRRNRINVTFQISRFSHCTPLCTACPNGGERAETERQAVQKAAAEIIKPHRTRLCLVLHSPIPTAPLSLFHCLALPLSLYANSLRRKRTTDRQQIRPKTRIISRQQVLKK